MPVTVRGTDILFNDGTTQSTAGAPLPSGITAIGSVLAAVNYSTSNLVPGNTIAGSSLIYVTGLNFVTSGMSDQLYVEGTNATTNYVRTASGLFSLVGARSGNQGAFIPSNTTTLPGTWRALNACRNRHAAYYSYTGMTDMQYFAVLVQRIS